MPYIMQHLFILSLGVATLLTPLIERDNELTGRSEHQKPRLCHSAEYMRHDMFGNS